MNDLPEFLLARIAEDEAVAKRSAAAVAVAEARNAKVSVIEQHEVFMHLARWDPSRVLAESEAKRRIVREHAPIDGFPACPTCTRYDEEDTTVTAPCPTLRALALPYADHPDYRQEWKP